MSDASQEEIQVNPTMCPPGHGRRTASSAGSLSEGDVPYSTWHTMQILSSCISSFATLGSRARKFSAMVNALSVVVSMFQSAVLRYELVD